MFTLRRLVALAFLAAVSLAAAPAAAQPNLFVASSLTDLAEALNTDWQATGGAPLTVVTGASSTLARQIEAGAPADLFISANRDWAEQVAETAGYSDPRQLFGNRLVIIAPIGFEDRVSIGDLPGMLGDGRLAVAETDTVPAGIYAREALQAAGVWDDLADRLAPADNVRAAVALVASRAAPFGIVYATDTAFPGVVAAGDIDPALHAPIAYWVTISPDAASEAVAFLVWTGTMAASEIIAGFGFEPAWDVPSP